MNKKVIVLIVFVLIVVLFPIGAHIFDSISSKVVTEKENKEKASSGEEDVVPPPDFEIIVDDPSGETFNIDGFDIPVDYFLVKKEGISSSSFLDISAVGFKVKNNMTKINVYFTNKSEFPIDVGTTFRLSIVNEEEDYTSDLSLNATVISNKPIQTGEKGFATTQVSVAFDNITSVKVSCDSLTTKEVQKMLEEVESHYSGEK